MYTDYKLYLQQPVVAKMVCLSLCLLVFCQVTYSLIDYYSLSWTQTSTNNIPVKTTASIHQPPSVYLTTPLFGEYVPINLKADDVKQSMLNLSVVGIVFARHEQDSYVILRSPGGKEQAYRIDDIIPGGARIQRITVDGVLVIRNGVLESLSLPKNELIFDPPAKPLN